MIILFLGRKVYNIKYWGEGWRWEGGVGTPPHLPDLLGQPGLPHLVPGGPQFLWEQDGAAQSQ